MSAPVSDESQGRWAVCGDGLGWWLEYDGVCVGNIDTDADAERLRDLIERDAVREQPDLQSLLRENWDEDYDARPSSALCGSSEDGRAVLLTDTIRGWRMRFGERDHPGSDELVNADRDDEWIPNDMAAAMVRAFTSGWVPAVPPPEPETERVPWWEALRDEATSSHRARSVRYPVSPERPEDSIIYTHTFLPVSSEVAADAEAVQGALREAWDRIRRPWEYPDSYRWPMFDPTPRVTRHPKPATASLPPWTRSATAPIPTTSDAPFLLPLQEELQAMTPEIQSTPNDAARFLALKAGWMADSADVATVRDYPRLAARALAHAMSNVDQSGTSGTADEELCLLAFTFARLHPALGEVTAELTRHECKEWRLVTPYGGIRMSLDQGGVFDIEEARRRMEPYSDGCEVVEGVRVWWSSSARWTATTDSVDAPSGSPTP